MDIEKQQLNKVLELLTVLYGSESSQIYKDLLELVQEWKKKTLKCAARGWVSQNDVMLITYADSIMEENEKPLATLKKFLDGYAKDSITAVHILPMYPFTSDDGFSVVDYYKISEELGTWVEIENLAHNYDMMYDAVVNHISKSSDWFKRFLNCEDKYRDYFIVADPNKDYSKVTRPRALPLLTEFETKEGPKHVWTTFSEDQIDLNFKSPDVLIEVLKVLLTYVQSGARFIRLDAIGFIWKEDDTTCMHLEKTHAAVKLMRAILDIVFHGTILITETNVPHNDNISYFGNGSDEAQLVYQFPLPPLVLFSFLTGNAKKLGLWAKSLEDTQLEGNTTYFNFLASHDGIGMRPTEGVLTEQEKEMLLETVTKHGGKINYKFNTDGTKSAYELNINYMDALTDPKLGNITERVDKFIAAQSILLSVVGVPGIYIHSLLGSQNWYEGVEQSGINRRINREKLNYHKLCTELEDANSLRATVFSRFSELIRLRRMHSAFSPNAEQKAIFLDERAFSFVRYNCTTNERILVIVNVSSEEYDMQCEYVGTDIVANEAVGGGAIRMKPYQTRWVVI